MGRALAWTSGCAVGTGSKQTVKLYKEHVLINKAPEDYASHKARSSGLGKIQSWPSRDNRERGGERFRDRD